MKTSNISILSLLLTLLCYVSPVHAANVSIVNDPDDDEPPCEECAAQCDRLSSNCKLGSVTYRLGLGNANYLADGILRKGGYMFRLDLPSLADATVYSRPITKVISRNQPAGEVISSAVNGSARIRQVLTERMLADIVDLPSSEGVDGYVISIYKINSKPANTYVTEYGTRIYVYATTGAAIDSLLKRVIVRNPDGTTLGGRLEIVEEDYFVPENAPRYKTVLWEDQGATWKMSVYAGKRGDPSAKLIQRETLTNRIETGGEYGEYTQNRVVEEVTTAGALLETSRTSEKCAIYRFDITVPIERSITANGQTRTDTWTYYTDIANEASFGRVATYRRWDGYWENYRYESVLGDFVRKTVVRPWLESTPDNEAQSVVESRLENRPLRYELNFIQSIAGKETRKNTIERVTQADGTIVELSWQWANATSALLTRNTYYSLTETDSAKRGRLKSAEHPDGTFTLGTYTTTSDGGVRSVMEKGSGSLSGITAGIRTSTVTALTGQIQEEVTVDIASGLEISRSAAGAGTESEDAFGRVMKYVYDNNPDDYTMERLGSCGALMYRRERDGRETTNSYDDLKRIIRSEVAYPGQTPVVTTTTYDGLITHTTVNAGSLTQTTIETRNGFGEVVSVQSPSPEIEGQTVTTTTAITTLPQGGTRTTVTHPDGATSISETYRDGQPRRSYGTAEVDTSHAYGLWADGLWTQTFVGGTASTTWTKSYGDMLDRPSRSEQHLGGNQLATTSYSYNAKGQLAATIDPDGLATLYAYDDQGEQYRTVLDANDNGVIDLAGPDRVTEVERRYVNDNGLGISEEIKSYIYPKNDSSERLLTNTTTRSIAGLKSRSESFGRVSRSEQTRSVDGAYTSTVTGIDGTKITTTYQHGRQVSMANLAADNTQVTRTDTAYDALGRVFTQTDARTGAITYAYGSAGQLLSTTDAESRKTQYTYDKRGRILTVKFPDNTVQIRVYDLRGNLTKQSGSLTYTTGYVYDDQNRQTELRTYKDGDTGAAQTTTWTYDSAGRLTKKAYADGKGPSYTYSPGGQLLARTWARNASNGQPLKTTFNYNTLGALFNITYSDTTPAVSYTYNRLGQQSSVTDGTGTRNFTYRASDLGLDAETHTGLFNATISREYDSLGRLLAIATADVATRYAYDSAGRLQKIERLTPGAPIFGMPAIHYSLPASADETYTYAYLANSNLIATVSGPQHTVANTYEAKRNVLSSKENKIGTTSISRHVYTVNNMGQRTAVAQTGSAFGATTGYSWLYNTAGEVAVANHKTTTAHNRAFRFDGIGNRLWATEGNATQAAVPAGSVLSATKQTAYTANTLNQYTKIGSGIPTYDLDGNMLTDGAGVAFVWDAENRLVQVTLTGGKVTKYIYDASSRRVKREYLESGVLKQTTSYLYDSWDLVAEYESGTGSLPVSPIRTYLWGQGIGGGVGGLLSIKEGATIRAYSFDGNGNVSEVMANNAVVAHYEYDPFGNTIIASGTYAATNPWRFSTKPLDSISSLYYYGYRWYSALYGRWPNRDPIDEKGGINLYLFTHNDPLGRMDFDGLWDTRIHLTATRAWAKNAANYPATAADAVAQADEDVDKNISYIFEPGTQYHFNRMLSMGTSRDTRLIKYDEHMQKAFDYCAKAKKTDSPKRAAQELGTALHPYQDWVAHGDHNIKRYGSFGAFADIHNWMSRKRGSQTFPDDPTLDVKGAPDGRASYSFLNFVTDSQGITRDWAEYEPGNKRLMLTYKMTYETLVRFREYIRQNGDCACKVYFGVN